jgi:beta-1,4-mannosyltransferase
VLIPRLLGGDALDPVDAAVDAVRLLAASPWPPSGPAGTAAPALLVTVGAARGNPLPELLGAHLAGAGIAAVTVADLPAARAVVDAVRSATECRARIGIHLHWLHRLVAATTHDGARLAADGVAADLAALHAAGVAILWTVHNVLPHDAPFPEVQLALRKIVAGAADLVHVLEPDTARLAAPHYELPAAKVRHLPHPGWQGVYPDWVSRDRARARLALPPDVVVYVLFGRLSADKGVAELVEAFTRPEPVPGARLLLAGPPPRDPDDRTAAALAVAARHPQVDLWPRRVADDEVQIILRAADVAVSPQRVPLNSGSRLLALTFGLPVVATVPGDRDGHGDRDGDRDGDGDGERSDSACLVTAPAGDVPALRAALIEAGRRLLTPQARAAASEAADAVHPRLVAARFSALIAELLDLPVSAA